MLVSNRSQGDIVEWNNGVWMVTDDVDNGYVGMVMYRGYHQGRFVQVSPDTEVKVVVPFRHGPGRPTKLNIAE